MGPYEKEAVDTRPYKVIAVRAPEKGREGGMKIWDKQLNQSSMQHLGQILGAFVFNWQHDAELCGAFTM
jgi:hypothetical protein